MRIAIVSWVTATFVLAIYIGLVLLISRVAADEYFGQRYVCPVCGSRRADRHSPECPWSHGA